MYSSAALEQPIVPKATSLWQSNPVLASAGETECAHLARRFPVFRRRAGEPLAVAGRPVESLLVLHEGTVRLFHRAADSREALVLLVRAPALLGHAEALADQPWVVDASALTRVQVSFLDADDYRELLDAHPEVVRASLRNLSRTACLTAHNQRQVFAMLEQRVANLLLTLAELHEAPHDDEAPQIIPGVTMPMLANSLGTIRRSVAKVVAALTKRKLITRHQNGDFVLLEPEALEELARPIRGGLIAAEDQPLSRLHTETRPAGAEVEVFEGALEGQRYPVDRELMVGRHVRCSVQLSDAEVSPWHCRLYRASTSFRYWVEDLGSDSGTYVDGKRVVRAVLHGNEVIEVGGTRLVFRVETAPNIAR